MKTLLIFLLLTGNVFAYTDGGSYPDTPTKPLRQRTVVKPEPIVRVERYSAPDYKNDPAVLIAGVRSVDASIAKNKISKNAQSVRDSQLTPTIIYKDRLVIDKPQEPIITSTYEEN